MLLYTIESKRKHKINRSTRVQFECRADQPMETSCCATLLLNWCSATWSVGIAGSQNFLWLWGGKGLGKRQTLYFIYPQRLNKCNDFKLRGLASHPNVNGNLVLCQIHLCVQAQIIEALLKALLPNIWIISAQINANVFTAKSSTIGLIVIRRFWNMSLVFLRRICSPNARQCSGHETP